MIENIEIVLKSNKLSYYVSLINEYYPEKNMEIIKMTLEFSNDDRPVNYLHDKYNIQIQDYINIISESNTHNHWWCIFLQNKYRNDLIRNNLIKYICDGDYDNFKYKIHEFKLLADDIRNDNNYILWLCYKYGYYEFVMYLINNVGLNIKDLKYIRKLGIGSTCVYNDKLMEYMNTHMFDKFDDNTINDLD